MKKEFRADLHCHSLCSDGSDEPLLLLEKAKKVGLQGLSITDHDTLAAYTPSLFSLAQTLSLQILPGVEISSEFGEATVHILGYGVHLEKLSSFLAEMQKRRTERNRAILRKLAERKIFIEETALPQKTSSVGRPHIAALLVQKGVVATFQEAFDRYLKEGAPCYVLGFKYRPEEVLEEIHKAQGKAVLAHPHFFKRGPLLEHLLSLRFDGIECHYGLLPPELEAPWIQIASEKGWIATGGSDYHGTTKPHIPLGCSWVDEETFFKLAALPKGRSENEAG